MNAVKHNNFDYLTYIGDVKVKILQGKKVYKEKTFHNNGRWPMFEHLAYALSGQYTSSDSWRPLVLGLYSVPYSYTDDGKVPSIQDLENPESWDKDPTDGDWKKVNEHAIKRYANAQNLQIANAAMLMVRPVITTRKSAGIGETSVTYKFLIPVTQLKIGDSEDANGWNTKGYSVSPINLVCLYSKNNNWWNNNGSETEASTYGNPNAFFFVRDSQQEDILGSLLPKSLTSNIGEYSISIEWTLKLTSSASTYTPTEKCTITWVDNFQNKTEVESYDWNKLPHPSITPNTIINVPEENYKYLFAGWTPTIELATEDTTYTTSYWAIDKTTGELISNTPVTNKVSS